MWVTLIKAAKYVPTELRDHPQFQLTITTVDARIAARCNATVTTLKYIKQVMLCYIWTNYTSDWFVDMVKCADGYVYLGN